MKKQCQVVMLPNNNLIPSKNNLVKFYNIEDIARKILDKKIEIKPSILAIFDITNMPKKAIYRGCIVQHLYILSDDEIKEGDWYLLDDNTINKASANLNMDWYKNHEKKIIASTDSSLELPRPSNEFKKKYCEKGDINEVLVEYMDYKLNNEIQEVLKVAPDNTITIYPIEETFSKEEVLSLFHQFVHEVAQNQASLQFLYKVKEEWLKNHI